MRKLNVLFICTGNTCRSPMAEALAAHIWGRDYADVSSAGLFAYGNAGAGRHSVSVMRNMGLDITGHKARTADDSIIRGADLILTMTQSHRDTILQRFSGLRANVYTLAEYSGGANDVPDPFGMDEAEYNACALQLKKMLEASDRFILHLHESDGIGYVDILRR